MGRLKQILNYEITPRRKKRKKTPRSFARFDIELIKILIFLSGPFGLVYYFTGYRTVKLKRMMVIFRSIRMVIHNNAPLPEGLRKLSTDAPNNQVCIVLNGIADEIERGASLAEALESYRSVFKGPYIDLIGVGESTGRLVQCLDQVVESIEMRLDLSHTVTVNASYISFAFFFQVSIVTFLVAKVIPVFEEIYSEFALSTPFYARALLGSAAWLGNNTYVLFFAFVVFVQAWIIISFLRRKSGWVRSMSARVLYAVPLVGRILRLHQLHRISEAMEELVSAGIPMNQVFEKLSELEISEPYKRRMALTGKRLGEGASLKDALGERSWLLGSSFGAVLGLGDFSGNISGACARLTSLYRRDFDWRLTFVSESMVPVYVLIGGALNLWVMVSIYGMLFGLSDFLNSSL